MDINERLINANGRTKKSLENKKKEVLRRYCAS